MLLAVPNTGVPRLKLRRSNIQFNQLPAAFCKKNLEIRVVWHAWYEHGGHRGVVRIFCEGPTFLYVFMILFIDLTLNLAKSNAVT